MRCFKLEVDCWYSSWSFLLGSQGNLLDCEHKKGGMSKEVVGPRWEKNYM